MPDFKEIPMEVQEKALREALRKLTPAKAIAAVKSFQLTADEERYIIDVDVLRKSIAQTAMEHYASEEAVKRNRKRGFCRMILELNS